MKNQARSILLPFIVLFIVLLTSGCPKWWPGKIKEVKDYENAKQINDSDINQICKLIEEGRTQKVDEMDFSMEKQLASDAAGKIGSIPKLAQMVDVGVSEKIGGHWALHIKFKDTPATTNSPPLKP